MSKKEKYTLEQIKQNTTNLQYKKIEVLYDLFRNNVSNYKHYKSLDDKTYLDFFTSTFRSQIFDVSSAKIFKTGFKSTKAVDVKNTVEDHFIQRAKTSKFIFESFCEKPKLSFISFVNILISHASTVVLTKEEHNLVTLEAKKNKDKFNYELYESCNITIPQLYDFLNINRLDKS